MPFFRISMEHYVEAEDEDSAYNIAMKEVDSDSYAVDELTEEQVKDLAPWLLEEEED